MPSLYQQHVAKWKGCQLCSYCETRRNVVLVRGKLPCDVLFIGEAPGPSEDALGKPFIGPAGKLLDEMIADSFHSEVRLAFTNLVACIPKNGESGKKFDEPSKEAIAACSDRLSEIIEIAQPSAIVCVGKLSTKYLMDNPESYPLINSWVEIIHPAAILRADVTMKGLMCQKTVAILSDLASSFVPF